MAEAAFKSELANAWSECEEARDARKQVQQQAAAMAEVAAQAAKAREQNMRLQQSMTQKRVDDVEDELAAMTRKVEEATKANAPPMLPAKLRHSASQPQLLTPASSSEQDAPPPSFSTHVHAQLVNENQVLRHQVEV